MKKTRFSWDPYQVLGIPLDAAQETIRAAYVTKVKEFPPDRAPEQFERVRDAYEMLSEPRKRADYVLFSADPEAPFVSLLDGQPAERRFVGPKPWLDAIKGS